MNGVDLLLERLREALNLSPNTHTRGVGRNAAKVAEIDTDENGRPYIQQFDNMNDQEIAEVLSQFKDSNNNKAPKADTETANKLLANLRDAAKVAEIDTDENGRPYIQQFDNMDDQEITEVLSQFKDNNNETSETDTETVSYTYKPGDSFGQVILDLGLGTEKGLWGSDGDVEYYNKQLYDQGVIGRYPDGTYYGNIPIGTTIKLRKRK